MSVVNITNIQVLDNPTRLGNPFQFEITFECIAALQHDLEWKIVYVGSAEDETYDQVLDCIMVGPVPVGINKFVFQADPPKLENIPAEDLIGVTVVLITCSYNDCEFVRVGYYVNNEYDTEEWRQEPPPTPHPDRVVRTILADKPRVTRFPIKWDDILDETLKKPEDEELDRDADFAAIVPPTEDDHEFAEEEEDDDEEEGQSGDVNAEAEEEEEEDDDEFTSQLGPEEQDRMSMMIDEDGDHQMADSTVHEDHLTQQLARGSMQQPMPLQHSTKPSPLALQQHDCENMDMNMMI